MTQNQEESDTFDILRLLVRFGADCRLKDKFGNNGKNPFFFIICMLQK
jgi:hypothetical protein